MNNSNTNSSNSLLAEPSHSFDNILSLMFLFIGAFWLFWGVNKIVRVFTRAQNPYSFQWFTAICVLFFSFSFFVAIMAKRSIATDQKKRGILILLGLVFLVIIFSFVPYLYLLFTLPDLTYGTDIYWYKETFLVYFQFAFSGLFFASIPFKNSARFDS